MDAKNLEVERRRVEATEVIEKYTNAVPKDLQKKILALQIDVGMDPYMARLAAGDIKMGTPTLTVYTAPAGTFT